MTQITEGNFLITIGSFSGYFETFDGGDPVAVEPSALVGLGPLDQVQLAVGLLHLAQVVEPGLDLVLVLIVEMIVARAQERHQRQPRGSHVGFDQLRDGLGRAALRYQPQAQEVLTRVVHRAADLRIEPRRDV